MEPLIIWKCTGRLYNEQDVRWMWSTYRRTQDSAKAVCEAQAEENNWGPLAWQAEDEDGYMRAMAMNRSGWIYEVERVEVLA